MVANVLVSTHDLFRLRLSLPDFWNIPGTHGFLAFLRDMFYGVLSDGDWQERFNTSGPCEISEKMFSIGRAGYIRLGNENRHPLEAMLGLEMATTFWWFSI